MFVDEMKIRWAYLKNAENEKTQKEREEFLNLVKKQVTLAVENMHEETAIYQSEKSYPIYAATELGLKFRDGKDNYGDAYYVFYGWAE